MVIASKCALPLPPKSRSLLNVVAFLLLSPKSKLKQYQACRHLTLGRKPPPIFHPSPRQPPCCASKLIALIACSTWLGSWWLRVPHCSRQCTNSQPALHATRCASACSMLLARSRASSPNCKSRC